MPDRYLPAGAGTDTAADAAVVAAAAIAADAGRPPAVEAATAQEAVDAAAIELSDEVLLSAEVPEDEEPDGTPVRKRRLRRYVLIGTGAAVIVLGAVFGPLSWQLITQGRANLATPEHLAGLTLDHSSDGRATAEYLRTAVAASVSLNSSVGAVYDDPGDKQRSVMFFGGTSVSLSPDKELTAVFKLLDDGGGQMTGVHSVPAGPLGGEMKCGTSTGDGGDMTVCGWADHGSIALALFPGRTVDDAAALLVQMRDGIQHRS